MPLEHFDENYSVSEGTGYHGFPTIEAMSDTNLDLANISSVDNTDGKTFFQVEETASARELPNFITGFTCSETVSVLFFSIQNGSASATRTSAISCVDSQNLVSQVCEVIYNGQGLFIDE